MHTRRVAVSCLVFLAAALFAVPADGGFSGSELFLPSVGRGTGMSGSQWSTTLWLNNPGEEPANVEIFLLERDQPNPAPESYLETVLPGETVRYEDAVGAMFGRSAFGALRVVADRRVVVASRIYSLQPGHTERDSVGQFFSAVPSTFAIGSGERTSVLGVNQFQPVATSEYRYNFGFVETTGQAATVTVSAVADDGHELASKVYSLAGFEPRQLNVSDLVPGIAEDNARIVVEVTGGSGRVIVFGSGLANASSDPSTFEMTYADDLIGGGAGEAVVTDQSLEGEGTPDSPLGIADGGVINSKLAADSVGSSKIVDGTVGPEDLADGAVRKSNIAATGGSSGDALVWNGQNLVWMPAPIHFPIEETVAIFSYGIQLTYGTSEVTLGGDEPFRSESSNLPAVVAITENAYGAVSAHATGGHAIYATNESSDASRYTVYGRNITFSNDGALGTAEAGTLGTGWTADGVVGRAHTDPQTSGIFGQHYDGGYAGYFEGKVSVTGNLSKAGGSFRIDHPLHPAEMYLQHSFVESPDMMNVYNGNAVLDDRGEAWVELPDWFEALNRDFRYQLTPIGGAAPALHVAEKVTGNRFKIAGGPAGLEVSWQVTGIRQDAWANAHRIQVEEAKPESERGRFLHPSLFEKSEQDGVTWVHRPWVDETRPDKGTEGDRTRPSVR